MPYPTSVTSFSVKATNDIIEAAHPNTSETEINAIESGLLNGLAHHVIPLTTALYDLGSTSFRWRDLWLSRNLTVGNTATIAGSLTSGGALLSTLDTGGVGYGTGAGGVATQLTSKTTGVTLNKASGQITMNGAALAADAQVSFVLTNSAIAAADVIVLNHSAVGTPGAYTLNAQAAAGSATINVRNVSTGSLSEAIVISFAVIKAVTA